MSKFPLSRRAVCAARRLAQLVVVLGGLAAALAVHATVITPVPVNKAYDSISGDYQMQVDDGTGANSSIVSVVHHYVTITGSNYTNTYYGHFAFSSGNARVTVTLGAFTGTVPTLSPTVSPGSASIAAAQVGATNQVQFTIQKGQPGIYLLNVGDPTNTYTFDLIVIADPAESDLYPVPASSGTGIFNTSSYGSSDGYSAETGGPINNAISAANAYYNSTGKVGTVYLPLVSAAGSVYKISKTITPMNGTQLYLPPGVILRADTNYADWAAYQNGGGQTDPAPLAYIIQASGNNGTSPYTALEKFTVFGRGTIDCKGVEAGDDLPYDSNKLRIAVAQIRDSQAIVFNGVVCRESTGITFDMDRDETLAFIDTKVINYANHNFRQNDGMDMYQCQNSTANHCFIYTGDDAVALKAGYAADDGDPPQEISGVVYNDMVVWTTVNGLKFGNSAYTNATNSYFANSDIVSAENGLSIEANDASASFSWSNLGYYNNTAESISENPLLVENTNGYIAISGVVINDYTCKTDAASKIEADTSNGGSIGSVSFADLNITGSIALNTTEANLTVSGGASAPTFKQDTNLIAGLTPTANSGNWSTVAGDGMSSLTDGSTTTQAVTTNTSQGQVTYSLGGTYTIDKVQVYQDYGTHDVQYWKVEYYNGAWNPLFPAGVINFDVPTTLAGEFFTTAGVDGWNIVGFPPVTATQVRITFQPSSGNTVGVNEVAVYGH